MDFKKFRHALFLFGALTVNLISVSLNAQQRHAVTVNVHVAPPYSVFLADYISPGSNKLMVTLVFNDFNEPSLDVCMKVKVESQNFRLSSRADYIPATPIHLEPGVPVQLSGDQLAPYFDLNNVEVAGMSKAELSTGGKLIEGNYQFYFEVYDYKRPASKPISSAFAMANVRLNDPARLVLPDDQAVVPLTSPSINFQWQLPSGDFSSTKYLLSLYQLPDYPISASVAVQNNQAVKIFESSLLDSPFYVYDMNSPLLKRGGKYAWRVQAVNVNKRDDFKNNGFSTVRSFSYGYPENGSISLKGPVKGHAFSLRESKTFRWRAPDNLTVNQPFFYRVNLVTVDSLQTDSAAIVQNHPVYTNQSPVLNPKNQDYEVTIASKLIESQKKYAWQVTAHTHEQTIATSAFSNCFGPPLIEAFYAGNHTVFVTSTTGNNLQDLTGEGVVQITHSGQTQKVYFEHIRIETAGALLMMKEGVVKAKYMGSHFDLKAEYEANGKATYEVDSIMIDQDYMRLKGVVKWTFPHATVDPSQPIVYSNPGWITFEDYVLNGIASLKKDQMFQLADPYGFTVRFDSTSYFIIRGNNQYVPHLDGSVQLPKNVKNPLGGEVKVPFRASEKIDFINQTSNPDHSTIELLEGTNINLHAFSYVIDFSEKESPCKLSGEPDWKGVYLSHSAVAFPVSPDKSHQLFLKNDVRYAIRDTVGFADTCWVTTQGLQLRVSKNTEQADTLWFNTFPGVFDRYGLTIQNSNLTQGYLKGRIAIPLLSEKDRFAFTVPISLRGFATGYLDQSLDGFKTVFNADGGEQKIDLLINRAVFAGKERLDMNIDLSWPLMDITMKSIEGLKIWGNGNIGFQSPNGVVSLYQQMQTVVKGYEVTIDYVGCGRQENLYSFGTSADIVMAEDVTGPDGAPKVNIFSIAQNSLLSGNFQNSVLPDVYQNILVQSGGASKFGTNQTVGVKQDALAQVVDSVANPVSGQETDRQAFAMIEGVGDGGDTSIDPTLLLSDSEPEPTPEVDNSDGVITVSMVVDLINKVIPFLKDDQRLKAEAWKAKIAEYEQSEIVTIYQELQDYDKFLKELAKQSLQMMIAKLNQPILEQSAKVKAKVVGFIDGKRDELLGEIDKKIVLLIDSIGTRAAKAVASDQKAVMADIIARATEGAKYSIPLEINHSVSLSVKKNITDKVVGILDSAITYQITGFIEKSLSGMGNAIIDNGVNGNMQFDKIGADAKTLLPNIGDEVFQRVTSIQIGTTIQNTIVDAFKGIRWDEVGLAIGEQVLYALAETKVVKKLQDAADKAVANLVGENGGEVAGAIAGSLMKNVKLDFSNIGDKLKNGEIDQIIKFDPSYIKVPTPIAVFEGWVKFTDDDPLWGDSWQASVSAQIKVGFSFTASAQYVNGSVSSQSSSAGGGASYKYWFLQIGADGLNIPMTPTPFTLDGANGKIFHHMSRVSTGVYQPSDSVRFGAGMQMFFFDTSTQGSIIAFDINAEISVVENGFVFEMFGNAAVGNGNVVVKGVDFGKHSLVAATGYLGYNSIERHLIGDFNVTFNTAPLLCAGGEMGIDIKPGQWSVYVGKREQPIFVDLFCTKHPLFKGWFAINNQGIDMGVMVYVHIRAESPWIGISLCKVKPWAEFKLDFGATAVIAFKPFAIEEARVWIDIYAGIGVRHKTFFSSGNLTIASVNLGGEVLFKTTPNVYFKGDLHGRVVVFNIGVGFKMGVEHQFA